MNINEVNTVYYVIFLLSVISYIISIIYAPLLLLLDKKKRHFPYMALYNSLVVGC